MTQESTLAERMRLTKTAVAKMMPGDKVRRVFDADVPKFAVKITPGGAMTYVVYARNARGHPTDYKIGSAGSWTPEQARDEARRMLVLIDQGKDPRETDSGASLFSAVADEYLKRELKRAGVDLEVTPPARYPDNERAKYHCFKRFERAYPGIRMDKITYARMESYLDDRFESSPHGARRDRSALSTLIDYYNRRVENRGDRIDNVASECEITVPADGEVLFIEADELAKLMNELERRLPKTPTAASALRFLARTGLRPAEALELMIVDNGEDNFLDLKKDRIVLRRHKTRRVMSTRELPLPPRAREVITQMHAVDPSYYSRQQFLFPSRRPKDPKRQHITQETTRALFDDVWEMVCDHAEAPVPAYRRERINQRHLRHTFATTALSQDDGMSVEELKWWMGHRHITTTQKYLGAAEALKNRVRTSVQRVMI